MKKNLKITIIVTILLVMGINLISGTKEDCIFQGGECQWWDCDEEYIDIGNYCGLFFSCCELDVQSLCESGGDINSNNEISRIELGLFIDKWVNGEIGRLKLGKIIKEWVEGCYPIKFIVEISQFPLIN